VVPLSVLSNWEKQIRDHCVPNTLSHAVYYGSGRNLSAKDLQKYDVVVTTYQVVGIERGGHTDEVPNKRRRKDTGSLFEVQWKVLAFISSIPCVVDVGTTSAHHSGRGS
jgi:SWI/SNF-related matrix-associated actin-dependent regulator of chromatin subfamily A3